MSPTLPTSSPRGARAALSGWGGTAPSVAELVTVAGDEQVADAVLSAGSRGVLARGLGRSYGDAAQNGGGRVLEMTGRSAVLGLDEQAGVVHVQAGISLDTLIRQILPHGWFVPVTPGTRQVTVGGAIASDVHGKNHHRDGSFGAFVQQLTLVTGDGQVRTVRPPNPLFWATIGGMGLTGVILAATLRLTRVHTSTVLVDTWRCPDLDAVMARMQHSDDEYDYSVAWLDTLARGRRLGRSVLTAGRFATVDELPPGRRDRPLRFDPHTLLTAPPGMPGGALNRWSVAAFNELWFRKAPAERRGEPQSIGTFFHPLDGVARWNRIYGPRGLLQYQVLVPLGRPDVIRQVVEAFSGARLGSFLSVLKRMGPGNPGHLSFPREGWTLTLDVPAGDAGVGGMLDRLDEAVVAAGGRSYFAKDSRMRPQVAHAMYPRLNEWNEIRGRYDPDGVFVSDLARRLLLCGMR